MIEKINPCHNHRQLLFILLSLLLLGGCSSSQNQSLYSGYPDEVARFSVVSTSMPGFVLPGNSSFGWHAELANRPSSESQRLREARTLIEEGLEITLRKNGHRVSPWPGARADYWVAYRVVLDSQVSSNSMVMEFGMAPGFVSDQSRVYDKGTLIIDLVDVRANRTVWRGSVEGLVTPDMPQDLRKLRLQAAIDQMLSGITR